MTPEARESFVWSELDRLYPPLPEPAAEVVQVQTFAPESSKTLGIQESGRVSGLSSIPNDWPVLPANASLGAEIAWVQAVRLDVVEELPSGGTRVRLEKAHAPAPSKAALSWLETSIRSYAKYVEVAAKASVGEGDEQAAIKRERMAIAEIRELLEQMR
jgi:hypothetical protein